MTMPYKIDSLTSHIIPSNKNKILGVGNTHSGSEKIKTSFYVNELRNEPNAIGLINNYKDHTDPTYVGPGTWNVIHRIAFSAQTHEQQLQFIDLMNEICRGFPCTVCRGHCSEYIKTHPMEEYLGVTMDIEGVQIQLGIFIWTWKFHNAVNARIKKPIMSWDTAYNLYSEEESLICNKNCIESENFAPDGSENLPEDPSLGESTLTSNIKFNGFSKPLIRYSLNSPIKARINLQKSQ